MCFDELVHSCPVMLHSLFDTTAAIITDRFTLHALYCLFEEVITDGSKGIFQDANLVSLHLFTYREISQVSLSYRWT